MSERFNISTMRTRAALIIAGALLMPVTVGGFVESAQADGEPSPTPTATATANATATDSPGAGESPPPVQEITPGSPTPTDTASVEVTQTTTIPKPSSTPSPSPTPEPKPLPKLCKIQIVGHRGSDNGRNVGQTEDTLNQVKAFHKNIAERAVRLHLTHIPGNETDIWKSATDRWFNNHDYTLNRTTNGTGPVPHHSPTYIASRRENDGTHPTSNGAELNYIGEHTQMPDEVEVKPDHISYSQAKMLDEKVVENHLQGRFSFTSFHAQPLQVLRSIIKARHQNIDLVYLSNSMRDVDWVNNFADGLSLDYDSSTKENAAKIHKAGLLAAAWTVNGVDGMRHKAYIGYDEVITEYPNHALDFCAKYVN